ncbi:MAG: hybrid sensor histidine kinase/response regulator [Flavobacterium sp.]|nr:MAG: hybrid sensor histidine kinase/response regulator [Flavobacterium sp.]
MRFLVGLFAFLNFCTSFGQDTSIRYLDIHDGMSNNSVNTIFQGRDGYMWFGTYDGLNRYDGYDFKAYRNIIGDSTSLQANFVHSLCEDSHDRLWIGGSNGGCVLDKITETFQSLYYDSGHGKREILRDIVLSIKALPNGKMLVGTKRSGLIVYDENSFMGKRIPMEDGLKDNFNYSVTGIDFSEEKQSLWVMVNRVGLCRFSLRTLKLSIVPNSFKEANCILALGKRIAFGTDEGFFIYDSKAEKITENLLPTRVFVTNLISDTNKIWIATDGKGVFTLSENQKMAGALAKIDNQNVLKSDAVWGLCKDKLGGIWIGTLRGGATELIATKTHFKKVKAVKTQDPNENFILSFCEDKNGNIWVGTDGAGLKFLNRKTGQYETVARTSGTAQVLSSNFITGLLRDVNDDIWLATWSGGLNRLSAKTGKIEWFKCINPFTKREEKNIWCLFKDNDQNIWASATNEGTLYKFNRKAQKFEVFDRRLSDLLCLTQTKDGKIWSGDYNSLYCVDVKNRSFKSYKIGYPIRSILEDKNGRLWVGTSEGGLLNFDPKNGHYQRFTTTQGLSGNTVLRLLEDKNGRIWMSTYNGLSRLDAKDGSFRNFSVSDGLQSNQFSFNAALSLSSGEFLFGGIDGFNVFDPTKISDFRRPIDVKLTGILVNNKPLSKHPDLIGQTEKGEVKSIELPFDQTTISLDFAGLDFRFADKIGYAYKLEGWENHWNFDVRNRNASYTRLSAGTYVFKVRTTDLYGKWKTPVALLTIEVLPPWYLSWYAYLLYFTIVASAVYAYLRYNRYKERMKFELRLVQMESQKEKEMAERQLSMFTYISHEFRTPVSLIINPLRKLLRKDESENASNPDLLVAHRNARRLLSLVDQLLLFRKAGSEVDDLKISQLDLRQIVQDVFESFTYQAQEQKISYQLDSNLPDVEIFGDLEKIEIALFNLVANAFKYTPEGGQITLKLEESENEAIFRVIDTGVGIAQEEISTIFEKFRQANPKVSFGKGFGIGLFVVKNFIDKHHGRIDCESIPGKGTTFSVVLKKGKSHLNGKEISNQVSNRSQIFDELRADKIENPKLSARQQALEDSIPTVITDKKSVLIVDDDDEIRNYLLTLFGQHYVVFGAANGQQGFESAKKNVPDVVVTDLNMDEIDGLELCRKLKSDSDLGHIPVVLLTASSASETELEGITGGADDYITKPFDSDILLARIETLLKSRSQLRNYYLDSITLKENSAKVPTEYKEFLENCIAVIEGNLDDKDFTIKSFSKAMGMSHSSLYTKIKAISGQTLNAFIRSIRLRKAALLLLTEDVNILQASTQVGFEDQKYFRQQFVKLFGMTPSAYVKKYRVGFNREMSVVNK